MESYSLSFKTARRKKKEKKKGGRKVRVGKVEPTEQERERKEVRKKSLNERVQECDRT